MNYPKEFKPRCSVRRSIRKHTLESGVVCCASVRSDSDGELNQWAINLQLNYTDLTCLDVSNETKGRFQRASNCRTEWLAWRSLAVEILLCTHRQHDLPQKYSLILWLRQPFLNQHIWYGIRVFIHAPESQLSDVYSLRGQGWIVLSCRDCDPPATEHCPLRYDVLFCILLECSFPPDVRPPTFVCLITAQQNFSAPKTQYWS